MAIYLDFVGLNTLIHEPISSSVNTIGYEKPSATTIYTSGESIPRETSFCLHSPSTDTEQQAYLYSSGFTFPTTGGLSNSFWIKLDSPGVETRTIWENSTTAPDRTRLSLFLSNGKLSFYAKDPSLNYKRWDWVVNMESLLSWNQITLTWNGNFSSNPSLFINSNLQSVASTATNGATGTTIATFDRIYLLDARDASELYELKGKVQDFALYDKRLTTSEVLEIYNDGGYYDLSSASMLSDIFVYWKLGEELSGYDEGDAIPNGTNVASSLGTSINLIARDNTYLARGYWGITDVLSYENTSLGVLSYGSSLAALNTHRNGPYGYSTFKQLRASQNPLTRYHNTSSIFSYVRDGLGTQTNGRETFIPKRTELRQIVESPIVSNILL